MRLSISAVSLVVAAGMCAAPVLAQNTTSHSSGGAAHSSASTGSRGGTFGSGYGSVTPPKPQHQNTNFNNGHPRPLRYGYGYYGYGAPYYIQSDNEYDQLPGHGTLDNGGEADNAPDNRVGPTIFEHNGGATAPRGATAIAHKPQQAAAADDDTTPAAEAVLIFRDGHQMEVSNFATTPNHVIVLGEHPSKIALSDLDLDATKKANEARGVEFKTPAQS